VTFTASSFVTVAALREERYPSFMLAQTIRDYLEEVPFIPFIIQVNDGRRFTIPHPDFAHVAPKGSTVTVYGDKDGGRVLSSLLIASVELMPRKEPRKKRPSRP
jgi:hypothetical protein